MANKNNSKSTRGQRGGNKSSRGRSNGNGQRGSDKKNNDNER